MGNEYIPPETRPLKALGGEEKSTRKEGNSVDRRGVERVLVLTYCILPGTVLSYIKYCTVLYCTTTVYTELFGTVHSTTDKLKLENFNEYWIVATRDKGRKMGPNSI